MNISLPAIAHTRNAVILRVEVLPDATVKYRVIAPGGKIYYEGGGVADSLGIAEFNIMNILHRMVRSYDVESSGLLVEYPDFISRYSVVADEYRDGTVANTASSAGLAVFGGTGNDIFRRMQLEGTDIFKLKLLQGGLRIMTTRTETAHLTVRETELMPLRILFSETETSVRIKTSTSSDAIDVTVPGAGQKRVAGLNMANIRREFFDRTGEIFSEFLISIDGRHICTYTITPSGNILHNRTLRYRNTFGAYECFEVSGMMEYIPELGEAKEYKTYDKLIDDYTFARDRLTARRVFIAECGYKTPEELYALQDMLQSDDLWLVAGNLRYGAIVDCDEPLLAKDEFTPGSIELTIKLKDESYGIELDADYLFPVYQSRWQNAICREIEVECRGRWKDFVQQILSDTGGSTDITQTNITDKLVHAIAAPDGSVYFYSTEYSYGIMKAGANGGEITQTNITSGTFNAFAAPDGTVYFLHNDYYDGILKKTPDNENIVPTVIDDRIFHFAMLAPDGSIYFVGDKVVRLKNGEIVKVYATDTYSGGIIAQNGNIYLYGGSLARFNPDATEEDEYGEIIDAVTYLDFGFDYRGAVEAPNGTIFFHGRNNGIKRLNTYDDSLTHANVADKIFTFAFKSSDGNVFFGGNSSFSSNSASGIFVYDTNIDSIIQTNVTEGDFIFATEDSDGNVYFGGYYNLDIYKRPAGGGDIVAVYMYVPPDSYSEKDYTFGFLAPDGTMYFGGGSVEGGPGIKKLPKGGDIILPTNLPDENYNYTEFFGAVASANGRIYFLGNIEAGVFELAPPPSPAGPLMFATTLIYEVVMNGAVIDSREYSILAYINAEFPAITLQQWQAKNDEYVNARAAALLQSIDKCDNFTEENNIIEPYTPEEDEFMIGQIIDFAGKANAYDINKWMMCDGAVLAIADYPELYDAIGKQWESATPTDAQHFRLPQLGGRSTIGYASPSAFFKEEPANTTNDAGDVINLNYARTGNIGGKFWHFILGKQMPKHRHFSKSVNGDDGASKNFYYCSNMGNAGDRSLSSADGVTVPNEAGGQTGESGNGEQIDVRTPYAVVYKLIRYKL
jgi:microcystin-dependent protein